MKNIFNIIKRTTILFFGLAVLAVAFSSCEKALTFLLNLLPSHGTLEVVLPQANKILSLPLMEEKELILLP